MPDEETPSAGGTNTNANGSNSTSTNTETDSTNASKPITAEEAKKPSEKEELKNLYDNTIVNMKLMENSGDKEIVDIVSKFPWTSNPLKGGSVDTNGKNTNISFSHNIPFCYVIERKQTVNSNIANFINTLKIGVDSILEGGEEVVKTTIKNSNKGAEEHDRRKKAQEEAQREQASSGNNNANGQSTGSETPTNSSDSAGPTASQKTSKMINTGAKKLLETIGSIKDLYNTYVEKFLSSVASDQLQTKLLSPYRYLYYTQETGKKYVFPMLAPTELLNLNNSYGTDSKEFDIGGIAELMKQASGIVSGGMQLLNFFNQVTGDGKSQSSMEEYVSEMAKSFSYDQNGQEISIFFPLYNTVKKGCWIQNYRFILGFLIRNLPFKVSAYSYKPPLLYDILVPGTTHLPLCYVSTINVQSFGLIRQITCRNFIKELVGGSSSSSQMQVAVPEAWGVTIKFKCLLSNSSNLILDLANSPINITISQQ